MSAFRFYTMLAVICGLVVWLSSLFAPTEVTGNATSNPAAYSAPRDAGIEKVAQGFDR